MRNLLLLLVILFLGGCLVRTYTIEKPRVDTEISGNQGYLVGSPKEEVREDKLGDTRTISVFEIEFGPHRPERLEKKSKVEEDIAQKDILEEELEEVEEIEGISQEISPSPQTYQSYVVKKNDTLQKISRKFYGTTRKWKLIYDENKDVLKNPDKISPGATLRIPVYR